MKHVLKSWCGGFMACLIGPFTVLCFLVVYVLLLYVCRRNMISSYNMISIATGWFKFKCRVCCRSQHKGALSNAYGIFEGSRCTASSVLAQSCVDLEPRWPIFWTDGNRPTFHFSAKILSVSDGLKIYHQPIPSRAPYVSGVNLQLFGEPIQLRHPCWPLGERSSEAWELGCELCSKAWKGLERVKAMWMICWTFLNNIMIFRRDCFFVTPSVAALISLEMVVNWWAKVDHLGMSFMGG
jgi:hypothetical protein